jgi:MFS family permease
MTRRDDARQSSGMTAPRADDSVRRWLTIASVEGAFANVYTILTGGAFLTGLALYLGANDVTIGLLAALPFLAQTAQILSAYLVDRTGRRKSITLWAAVAARQSWWLIVPLLFLPVTWGLEALLVIVTFSGVAIMISTPAWMAWMADLVPERIRGRYFGFRSAAVAVTTLSATIVGGLILDYFRKSGQDHIGFAVIIGTAGVFALAATILLNKIPDRPPHQIRVPFQWSRLIEPFKDKRYRRLLEMTLAWNLAIGISAAFFAAHMLTNLGMSFTQISLYSCLASLVAVGLNRPWGNLIDRFGSKPVLVFCALGIALVPMIWWIPRADSLWILWFEAVYSGALWTGFNLAVFTLPIASSPREGRTMYLAMFSVVTGVAFFTSSTAGGILAESWSHVHWSMGKQTVVNYHLLFALSSLLRAMAAVFFMTFHEPQGKPLPIMVHFMGDAVLGQLSHGRRILTWLRLRDADDSGSSDGI